MSVHLFQNRYGSLEVDTISDYVPIFEIYGKDIDNKYKFSVDDAEKIALITGNKGIQLALDPTSKLFYMVLHSDARNAAPVAIRNLNFAEGINATETLDRLAKYSSF